MSRSHGFLAHAFLLFCGLTAAKCYYEAPPQETEDLGIPADAAGAEDPDLSMHNPGSDAGTADMAMPPADMAMPPADMTMPPADMTTPPADMTTPPADMTMPPSDPFDPASCSDPPLSSTRALSILGTAPRLKLADATLYRRTRTCPGMMPPCSAWSTPVPHTQSLLTYSGGSSTEYKTFSFPTHLILFPQSGQPRLSIRHETDYRHDGRADTRGVLFSFGADPMINTYPLIYVWDFFPKMYHYEDLQGLLGKEGALHAAEHCARVVFTVSITTEIAALYRY